MNANIRPARSVLRVASVMMYALGILGGLYSFSALTHASSDMCVERLLMTVGIVSLLTLVTGIIGAVCNSIKVVLVVNVPVLTITSVVMYLICKLSLMLQGSESVDGVTDDAMDNWLGFDKDGVALIPESIDQHIDNGGEFVFACLVLTSIQFLAVFISLLRT